MGKENAIKWNYLMVKEYINNTGCELISTEYKRMKDKLKIRCRNCNKIYESTFDLFTRNQNYMCRSCSYKHTKPYKYDIENIKEIVSHTAAKLISTEYINIYDKLEFKCECGNHFYVSWTDFNNNKRHQCEKCRKSPRILPKTFENGNVFGVYMIVGEYSTINRKNSKYYLCKCKVCGSESIRSKRFLKSIQSNICNCNTYFNSTVIDINILKIRVKEMSDCELLSNEYFSAHQKLKFKCACGKEFERNWANFTNKNKRQCKSCSHRESSLERKVRKIIEEHQINFISQYTYNDCIYKSMLPFDFYLPDYNCCIEVDGEHHFMPIEFFGGQEFYELQLKRDKIKNEYCKNNNIYLIHIPYWDINNTEGILEKKLQLN